ncbi:MAG: hypothetical protein P9M12_07175 [Candidatus Aceula lacicola]|nr:hypothetical protein [Candidatus Aceula lacicola]
MNREGLPEEKLLKIIRKKDKSISKKKADDKDSVEKIDSDSFERVFRVLNQLMILIVLVLAGYLLYIFIFSQNKVDDFVVDDVPAEISKTVDLKDEKSKPYEYYAQEIEERDVFSRPKPKQEEEQVKAENINLSESLRIVGIVLGDVPEAIIEDIKSRKIFFLHQGDEVLEGKIRSIKEGKIILDYNGSTIELFQ